MRSDRPRNQPLGEAQNAADVCVDLCVYDKKLGDVWNQRSVHTLGDRLLTGIFPSLPKQRRVFPSCEAELASIGCKFSLSPTFCVSVPVCLSVSVSVCLSVRLSLSLSFCLHALYKSFNSYFICFEYVWVFLLLYFLFFVHVYYQ